MPIPTPEPGLIISYAYLWNHEAESGQVPIASTNGGEALTAREP
jgi:hypothetical protein